MAKIKYDVSHVEVEEDRDFSTPVPTGVYTVRLTECDETTSKPGNPMLACTLEIVGGEFDGRYLWDNIVLIDSTEWKLAQFIRALDLKDKGALDTDRIIGTLMKARVKHETYTPEGGEARVTAKVAALLPMPEDEDDEDVDEEDDYEADDEDAEDEDVEDDASDDEDDEDDEEQDEPYDDWTIKDLTTEVKERGLQVKTTKTGEAKKKYLIAKLEKDDGASSEDPEPF